MLSGKTEQVTAKVVVFSLPVGVTYFVRKPRNWMPNVKSFGAK